MLTGIQQATITPHILASTNLFECIINSLPYTVPLLVAPCWHYRKPKRGALDIVEVHKTIAEVDRMYQNEWKDAESILAPIHA